MLDNTLNIIGIPVTKETVSVELESFLNSDIPTIYLRYTFGRYIDNDYNFLTDYNFINVTIDSLSEYDLISNKCLIDNYFKFPLTPIQNRFDTIPSNICDNIIAACVNLSKIYSNCRIVILTHGSPYLEINSSVLKHLMVNSSSLSINIIDTIHSANENYNNWLKLGTLTDINSNQLRALYSANTEINFPSLGFSVSDIPDILASPVVAYSDILDDFGQNITESNPVVLWTGGVDSTAIMAMCYKHAKQFSVIVKPEAQTKNPELYQYVIDNFDVIVIPDDKTINDMIDIDRMLLVGGLNDYIFPDLQHDCLDNNIKFKYDSNNIDYFNTSINIDKLKMPIREEIIQRYCNYFNANIFEAESFFDNYLLAEIQKFLPFEIKYYYQLKWIMKYYFIFQDLRKIINSTGHGYTIPLFGGMVFQHWGFINLDYNFDNYCNNYKNFKYPAKQYSYDVFKFQSILDKIPQIDF
jgi:hypothetical protein